MSYEEYLEKYKQPYIKLIGYVENSNEHFLDAQKYWFLDECPYKDDYDLYPYLKMGEVPVKNISSYGISLDEVSAYLDRSI